MVETMLDDYDRAYGVRSVSLRYFNAAGADPGGDLGERHEPETHLMPLVLQAALGRRAAVSLFGTDYDTPDGTCVRDYVHVSDLCDAHVRALHWLLETGSSDVFNVGTGTGHSVREVIDAATTVTGRRIPVEVAPRRPGDPPRLVAHCEKAARILGWEPRHSELRVMLEHAWRWERRRQH